MKRFAVFVVVFFAVAVSHATNLVIVTDEAGAAKAKEVVKLFKSTPPFSRMPDLTFRIVQTKTSTLGCQATPLESLHDFSSADEALAHTEHADRMSTVNFFAEGARPKSCEGKPKPTRLITCNTPTAQMYLNRIKWQYRAAYVMVVLKLNRYGGSGGTFPVMTSFSPATMMLHELMHQLGFADEYSYYDTCEADTYCDSNVGDSKSKSGYGYLPGTSFNVALFNAFNSYIDDQDVLNRHGKELPWRGSIQRTTPLQVNGKLGSPVTNGNVGVYPAITCEKATRQLDTWQADPRVTVMKSLQTNYVPVAYWATLGKSLDTRVTAVAITREKVF